MFSMELHNSQKNAKTSFSKTEANLCVKDDEITILLDKVDILKTESGDNIIFVQKAIDLFKIYILQEKCDEDIKCIYL